MNINAAKKRWLHFFYTKIFYLSEIQIDRSAIKNLAENVSDLGQFHLANYIRTQHFITSSAGKGLFLNI